LQVDKPLCEDLGDFVNSAFVESHSQVETVVVDFLQHFFVAEVALRNLKVAIDSFLVIA